MFLFRSFVTLDQDLPNLNGRIQSTDDLQQSITTSYDRNRRQEGRRRRRRRRGIWASSSSSSAATLIIVVDDGNIPPELSTGRRLAESSSLWEMCERVFRQQRHRPVGRLDELRRSRREGPHRSKHHPVDVLAPRHCNLLVVFLQDRLDSVVVFVSFVVGFCGGRLSLLGTLRLAWTSSSGGTVVTASCFSLSCPATTTFNHQSITIMLLFLDLVLVFLFVGQHVSFFLFLFSLSFSLSFPPSYLTVGGSYGSSYGILWSVC
mmetsp:Transcript_13686/g.33075  ORF Transcript_13686/g.33075 Transcript_13686/m.33075 type:complete len:262 (+) Transcript_13686:768-1553(+)